MFANVGKVVEPDIQRGGEHLLENLVEFCHISLLDDSNSDIIKKGQGRSEEGLLKGWLKERRIEKNKKQCAVQDRIEIRDIMGQAGI
ncbi:hypothetical protein DSM19430T_26430 [Desulfovibrio psychrotolerans]|uniref:Uncharacterized protein n=1 Tax=Desulfovibrio psychrotolerans TaxID=415242 RepID=A0A7J0BW67_9BACT|nr:hypothetical protein DSM19430T_26430 [Desulfovibrio psychrotolerans]